MNARLLSVCISICGFGLLPAAFSSAVAGPLTDFHRSIRGDYFENQIFVGTRKTGSFILDLYYGTNATDLQVTTNPNHLNEVTYKPFPIYQGKFYANMTFLLGPTSQMPSTNQTVLNVPIIDYIVVNDGPNDLFIVDGYKQIGGADFTFRARFEASSQTLLTTELAPIFSGSSDSIYTSSDSFIFSSPVGYPSDTGWQGWGGQPASVGPIIGVVPTPSTLNLVALALALAFVSRRSFKRTVAE